MFVEGGRQRGGGALCTLVFCSGALATRLAGSTLGAKDTPVLPASL